MVDGYDAAMAESPFASADVRFCETAFAKPGRLIDLGCGTGRLCVHFARRGFDCLGIDLSDLMLDRARANAAAAGVTVAFQHANLTDLAGVPDASFDYGACLFSTFGMIRGDSNRWAALTAAARVVKPGGVLVLHAHHRWFRGLGWRRFRSADLAMPQAYGGAPLTLRHFTRRELVRLVSIAGWRVRETIPVGIDGDPPRGWGGTYGFFLVADRSPVQV
jgi:SAM-dependent methyltransferase